ncbi:hypothetical protein K2173_010993 [Erythroxylum novogranatense]|uniref:PUM-HD domain-containing protein n=1 Tax=Erythroxylum novogranatense TaxID=1862640 RepID=A0AAV8T077_9ROSI|nr:hypothetical protein K2173_010993 [Erythroxylum novogranatense]
MATESPMRLVETSGTRKWPFAKDIARLGSSLKDTTTEEMGLLPKGHRGQRDDRNNVPSRSGSAPPSMEGSFAAIKNLLSQENFNMGSGLEGLSTATENCESEDQLRSDPAYFAYYCSNVNLNPRLPPPLISRDNRHLVGHNGGLGNNWNSPSLDDNGNKCFQMTRGSLATHKEEPEDDRSPGEASGTCLEDDNFLHFGQNSSSLVWRHKSVVDLIQEDFPRTPSPVYNLSRSSSHGAEEAIDHYTHTLSSKVSSMKISRELESSASFSDVCVDTYTAKANAMGLISESDSSTTPFLGSACVNGRPRQEVDETNATSAGLEGDALINNFIKSGNSRMDLNIKKKQDERQSRGRILERDTSTQQATPFHSQAFQFQVISQGMQLPLQPPGPSPPLYASAAASVTAGTPFYPNFQPSGIYSTLYSMNGYAPGPAFLPPFLTGYPSQGAFPMPFGTSSSPNFDNRSTPSSAGVKTTHAGSLQHLEKFYGQHGLMVQPPFMDPMHLQYFQHPLDDAYGSTVQQNHLASRGNAGSHIVQQKEPAIAAYLGDRKLQPTTIGSLSIPSPGAVGINSGSLYGVPPSISFMTQFPTSPLTSPVLPSSPISGINHLGRRHDMRVPQCSIRNAGSYSNNSLDDPKRHYFLEELKSSNARKFELADIAGRIVEFSVDQHGSRFIQQKLEHSSFEEKASVFNEVLPHASKLMTDVFGNYVIQKFFEYGSPEQRQELADELSGQVLQLSLQMYGCRVIQKALEVIGLDQKIQLMQELDGHVMRCVHDQNGNHVIQKCIECIPAKNIDFIISAFQGQVATLSTHPYGCRVVQRILEYCSDELQSRFIVNEILESSYLLAQDQYGNYVTQHVLERGKPYERSQIISKLTGKVVQMSQHKYASNVIEKCLEYGDAAERELLIDEIIGQSEENDNLLTMMKDQFANYVIQKILEISNSKQREILLVRIRVHHHALKKYTYGKHIVARFEQLHGEGCQTSDT